MAKKALYVMGIGGLDVLHSKKEGPQGKVELKDFIEVAREIKEALEALFRERGWI